MKIRKKLKVGDWVEVRSKDEILRTLDSQGQLDGMPFMPEMFCFCGQQFQVQKSAHKTCDYTTSYPYRSRRLKDTVHLEVRCDGQGHDGCQASCLLYWKRAWLKGAKGRSSEADTDAEPPRMLSNGAATANCTEADVLGHARIEDPNGGTPTYRCQSTQIHDATTPLAWWDLRQYFEDYQSGNIGLERIVSGLFYSAFYHLSQSGIGLGAPMRWFYDKFHFLWGGTAFPRNPGVIAEGAPTPSAGLGLQPGDLVRVKSQNEILQTVDSSNKNRGMYWDAELVPYCGGTYTVLKRVTKLIDEKTAKMVEMKTPSVILDGVVCQARYSPCRMLCPKSMYPYWREIWLERVVTSSGQSSRDEQATGVSSAGRETGSGKGNL